MSALPSVRRDNAADWSGMEPLVVAHETGYARVASEVRLWRFGWDLRAGQETERDLERRHSMRHSAEGKQPVTAMPFLLRARG